MTTAVSAARPRLGTDSATSVYCRGLHKRFPSGAAALRDVDLEFPGGRISVLLGPSGCGKTTLLRCIAGLDRPTAGSITIAGADVTDVDAGRRGVAMVFQNYGLYPDKTAFRNIEYPLRMARVPRRERHDRVHEIAALLRIEQLLGRKPAQLSGGEKQRVGIGRALVRRPGVLLLDEPLSSLDAALRATMRTELHALQRHVGTTMIHVTHDQTEALSLADQLVVMRDGRVEQRGAPEEVFAAPATTFVAGFLGAMNLLDAAAVEWHHATGGDTATVGLRPEDIRLEPPTAPSGVVLRGPVVHTELLGTERLVHVRVGQNTVRIRIGAADPVPADVVAHVTAPHVHRFDVNGERIAVAPRPIITRHSPGRTTA